jgi:hypothetical protein
MAHQDMLDVRPAEFIKNVNDNAARKAKNGAHTLFLQDGHDDLCSRHCFQWLSSYQLILNCGLNLEPYPKIT